MRKPVTSGAVVILLAVTASFAAERARMKITSSAFQEGGNIPSKFTCDGSDTSPERIVYSLAGLEHPAANQFNCGRQCAKRCAWHQ